MREIGPALIGTFFRWWRDELAALLPASWRGPLPVQLVLEDQAIAMRGVIGPQRYDAPLERLNADQTARLQTALANHPVDVALNHSVFSLTLSLPKAAERSLASAVRYQLMAQAPVPVDDLVWDARVVSRDKTTGQLGVSVAMVPFAKVQLLNDQLARLGISPQRIGTGSKDNELEHIFQRSRPQTSAHERRTRIRQVAIVAGLLAILPLILVGTTLYIHHLDHDTRTTQTATRDKLAVRNEALALAEHGKLLGNRLRARPATPDLAAIIAAHDKSDWAQEIVIDSHRLRVASHTQNASRLKASLEAAPALTGWQWHVLGNDGKDLATLEAIRR